jgi:AbiV family abortive infection protein
MNQDYLINGDDLQKGIKLCQKNVTNLLDDVEILCNNHGNESTASALYTGAIEEFGKLVVLKKCSEMAPSMENIHDVPKSMFRKGKGHNEKYSAAIRELPESCLQYYQFDITKDESFLPRKYKDEVIKLRSVINGIKKSFEANGKRGRFNGSIGIFYNFEFRKNLLYVDWDDKNKKWTSTILKENLRDNELEDEVEDEELDEALIDEDYVIKMIHRKNYPLNLLLAVSFFRKHIQEKVNSEEF